MAINFASKYSNQISKAYTTEDFLAGKTSNEYDFTGVKSLRIYSPKSVPMVSYKRSGANRYGTPEEMQDNVQELIIEKDEAFTLTIDKGNNAEQMGIKNAGKMLKMQIAERVVPMINKYCFKKFCTLAGTVIAAAKPTKATIADLINDMSIKMDDALVPDSGRNLFIPSEFYGILRLCPEFIGAEKLAVTALTKGTIGEILGFTVVKVPKGFLPDNCFMLGLHKDAAVAPQKIKDAKYHTDPPGISGDLLEGRWLFDAFVKAPQCGGVVALVLTDTQQIAPTITENAGNVTIASTGATSIKYTTDGSDPRYSLSAETYSAPVSTAAFAVGTYKFRTVAFNTAKFTSNLSEKDVIKA